MWYPFPTKYVALIKDMYNNVMTRVRTSDGDTDDFPIKIGLHLSGTTIRGTLIGVLKSP